MRFWHIEPKRQVKARLRSAPPDSDQHVLASVLKAYNLQRSDCKVESAKHVQSCQLTNEGASDSGRSVHLLNT